MTSLFTHPVTVAAVAAVLIAGMSFVYRLTKLCLAAGDESTNQLDGDRSGEPADHTEPFQDRAGFTETSDGKLRLDCGHWFDIETAERCHGDVQSRLNAEYEVWSRRRRWKWAEEQSKQPSDVGW